MALLSPIANCKIGDSNAFYTSLEGSLTTSYSGTAFSYGTPYLKSVTFSRNENLKKLAIYYMSSNRTMDSKTFNISLCQYKPCTVTSASPAVITITSHGYSTGDKVRFTATTIPTGMTKGVAYYVNVQSANTFWIYDTYANAIAGGATGQINTSSTGSVVSCNKVMSEQSTTFNTLTGNNFTNYTAGSPVNVWFTTYWNDAVTTTAGLWSILVSTDDATFTSTHQVTEVASFGATTATAVSNTDNFWAEYSIDFSTGFTFAGNSLFAWNANSDKWLYPNMLVDPSASSRGNMVIAASANLQFATNASVSFGKTITFTSQLSAGATSATMTLPHAGVSGTYVLQLFPRDEADNFQQISATFTNGSTAVSFSALTYNTTDKGAIAFSQASPYTFSLNTSSVFNNASQAQMVGLNIFAEEPRQVFAFTTGEVLAGASTMTVDRNTSWATGDTFYIGGQKSITASLTDNDTVYTVSTVTPGAGTDTITFTPNITATFDRATKSPVGISRFNANNAFDVVRATGSASLSVGGTSLTFRNYVGVCLRYITASSTDAYTNETCIPYYSYRLTGTGGSLIMGKAGCYHREISGTVSAISLFLGISGYSYLYTGYARDVIQMRVSGIPANFNASFPMKVKNFTYDARVGLSLSSEGWEIDGLDVWNSLLGSYGIALSSLYSKKVKNVHINNCSYGIFGMTGVGFLKNLYFGDRYANTYDIGFGSSAGFGQFELQTINQSPTVDTSTKIIAMSSFGYLSLTDIGGVLNNVRNIYRYGESTISGSGLSDTTSYRGNLELVLKSTSSLSLTSWVQTIPTGNIQNKDMMVGVWVKINSANYWTGTYQMPRLTINYDNGTEIYAEATQTTSWQYLKVPFSPTTTYGFITSTLSIKSSASLSDTVTYFGDISVLYPAGYTLNLGAFSNLNGGLPVAPTISTTVSAQDVWAADPTQFGASTVGDKVNKIKNDTGIIPALL